MKTCLPLLLLAILAAPARAELLDNPGFESGDFSSWLTFGPGWRTSAGDDARSGAFGVVNDVSEWHLPEEQWRGVYQDVPVLPGETYSAEVFVRAVNIAHSESWLEVKWKDADGALVGLTHQSAHVAADQLFSPLSLPELVAPAGAVSASVNAVVFMTNLPPEGESDFHIFDDFSFVQLPPNPVTNRSFETGDLAGWSSFGQGWRTGVGGDAASGAFGLVNDVLDSDSDSYRGVFQNIPVLPGTTYVASVSIRTLNLESSESWLEVQWLDPQSNFIAQAQTAHITNDQSFTRTSLPNLLPPDGAAFASLRGIVFMAAPPALDADFHIFDDFSFTPQTPSADPVPLQLSLSDPATLVLQWETVDSGFVLESCADLAAPAWTPVPATPAFADGHWVVSLSASDPATFYRLNKNESP